MDNINNEDVSIGKQIVKDYYEGAVLGKGAFGTALLCRKTTENNNKYVIKMINLSETKDNVKKEKLFNMLRNEIFILDILRNDCEKYIMCYIKTIIESPVVYVVCEYLDNYLPLNQLVKQDNSIPNLATICNDLLLGLQKLHSLNIFHRDIKPENIMYHVDTFNIKYIDFGLSVIFIDNITSQQTSKIIGTPSYMDPKLSDASKLSVKILRNADYFSLGMTFIALFGKGQKLYNIVGEKVKDRNEIYDFYSDINNHMKDIRVDSTIGEIDRQVNAYSIENSLQYKPIIELLNMNDKIGGKKTITRRKHSIKYRNQSRKQY